MPSGKAVIPKYKLFLLMLNGFCGTECILNGEIGLPKTFHDRKRI
jgi:hypothetical protein